ncbi:class I tRNA ligase family protein [Bosea sp. UC22_33]|uniref:class I tRNA ligase family protein n=1 Tax=Bosea sp. UC22_33 TaxID=3350165 RepID=UPI00366AD38D
MSRRILITSALPYVSGAKHLGNLIGSLLPADVHARFHRQIGSEVLFICATDEHGTPHRDRSRPSRCRPPRFLRSRARPSGRRISPFRAEL